MRKVLKKNIILYKPLFQVIIAGPVGVTLHGRNAGGQILYHPQHFRPPQASRALKPLYRLPGKDSLRHP